MSDIAAKCEGSSRLRQTAMAPSLQKRGILVKWGAVVEELSDQIGEKLRDARESAGWSVDDVALKTRIPKSVIEALEEADFTGFDSPTYARSFLSQYSEFLKVDAQRWLDALEPVSLAPAGIFRPSWRSAWAETGRRSSDREPSRGWTSGLWGLALSCGVIYAAILAYELLEKRFGGEAAVLKISREESEKSAIQAPKEFPLLADPGTAAALQSP